MKLTKVNTNPNFWLWCGVHWITSKIENVIFIVNHFAMKKIVALCKQKGK